MCCGYDGVALYEDILVFAHPVVSLCLVAGFFWCMCIFRLPLDLLVVWIGGLGLTNPTQPKTGKLGVSKPT